MNAKEAKTILALYRPGSQDDSDPDFSAALSAVRQDPELHAWFAAHCRNYQAIRQDMETIQPPDYLLDQILQAKKTLRPRFTMPWPVWAAAALILILATLTLFLPQPQGKDRLDNFRSRMVQNALRQYSMDILTNRADVVRQHLAAQGAPADFVIPEALSNRSLTGGGALRWRDHPVSMVCYDRGDGQMLFLFVVEQTAMRDAPPDPTNRVTARVNDLLTISWSRDGKTYVLAGPEEAGFYDTYP